MDRIEQEKIEKVHEKTRVLNEYIKQLQVRIEEQEELIKQYENRYKELLLEVREKGKELDYLKNQKNNM